MADTNPPQGSPGAPNGQPTGVPPNAVPKIELSQIMDVSKFQRDLTDIITGSFGEAGSKVEELLLPKSYKSKKLADISEISKKEMDFLKKRADAEMLFLKQVSTKQRFAFEQMRMQKAAEMDQLRKGGASEKQLNEYRVSAEKQIAKAKVAAEASEGGAAGAMGAMKMAATEYLGTIASVVGVWEILVKLLMQGFAVSTALGKSANALRSGGILHSLGGGTSAAGDTAAKGVQNRLFGNVGMVFSSETLQGFVKQLAKVPAVLDQAGGATQEGVRRMVGVLGNEFESMDQIIGTLGKAAEDTGMTIDQLTQAFDATKKSAGALKIDHLRQLNAQIQMRAVLRGVTTDAGAATQVMDMLIKPLAKIGASGVPAEVERLQHSFASFLGSMSVTKMTGMAAFANGGHIPTDKEIDEIMKNPVKLMVDFFGKLNKMNPNSNMTYAFAEKAAQATGFQLDARQVVAFTEFIKNASDNDIPARNLPPMEEFVKRYGQSGQAALAKARDIREEIDQLAKKLEEVIVLPLTNSLGSIQFLINKYGGMIPSNPLPGLFEKARRSSLDADSRRAKNGIHGEH